MPTFDRFVRLAMTAKWIAGKSRHNDFGARVSADVGALSRIAPRASSGDKRMLEACLCAAAPFESKPLEKTES
jgi:hypothetical protein